MIVSISACVTTLPEELPTNVPAVTEPETPLGLLKALEKLLVLLIVVAAV